MSETSELKFEGVAAAKLKSVLSRGYRVVGYAVQKGDDEFGFVTTGGFVGWWLPEYYPNHTSGAEPNSPIPTEE